MLEMWVQSLGWEDPLEEGMATHSNITLSSVSCLENPMDRRALWATVQSHKDLDMTEAT